MRDSRQPAASAAVERPDTPPAVTTSLRRDGSYVAAPMTIDPRPSMAGGFTAYAPTVVGAAEPVLDPWRRWTRVVCACALGGAVAYGIARLCPTPASMGIAWCRQFAALSGDKTAEARISAVLASSPPATFAEVTRASSSGHRVHAFFAAVKGSLFPRALAVASWEAVRVFQLHHPIARACVVALAPRVAYAYTIWALDEASLVLRALRESARFGPRVTRRRRLRKLHHATVEMVVFGTGVAAGAAFVLWAGWVMRNGISVADAIGDCRSFVQASGGAAASAAFAANLREAGAAPAAGVEKGVATSSVRAAQAWRAVLRAALPRVPAAYPDITAASAIYLTHAAGTLWAAGDGALQRLKETRLVLLFRANDDDDLEDGDGEDQGPWERPAAPAA
jgi:hypothetical protein